MSGGGDEPAPDGFWASVRRRYEDGTDSVTAIAASIGITRQALASRASSLGWTPRGKPGPRRSGSTVARLKALLQQRLSEFEDQMGRIGAEAGAATAERDIRAMNTLVRTLEKVLELERKERSRRKQQRKSDRRIEDAERAALAAKLEGLHKELQQERSDAAVEDLAGTRGADPQP